VEGCSRCGGTTIYHRRYSGERLCSSCFTDSVVDKTRRTISKYGMLGPRQRVGVAVSGGKDSLALLKVLHGLYAPRGAEIAAISVDEGVKGYREEALQHASALASELGVRHVVVSYEQLFGFSLDRALDWDEGRDVSSCSFCGVFRRRAIEDAALAAGVDVIATAHNLDDFVQTFLMNLMHGDTARLAWLHPSHHDRSFPMRRVKPFLEIYEEEVALFAHLKGIPFQSVSCPYMHEGLRSEVRDYLNRMEADHPGVKNVLLNSGLEVISRFTGEAPKPVRSCSVCGRVSSGPVCAVCSMKEEVGEHVNYGSSLPGPGGG
jgi:cytoplasmic tRNA 2-thiolation protein 1